MENKLSAILALSKLIGKTGEEIAKHEEDGTLAEIMAAYNNKNVHYSETDKAELISNTRNAYLKELVESDNELPTELFGRIKGSVLQQKERQLKNEFSFDGSFDGLDDLINKVIMSKQKEPNESRPEDLAEIEKLKGSLVDYHSIITKNQHLVQQATGFDEKLLNEKTELTNTYQDKIKQMQLDSIINNIAFEDNGSAEVREILSFGFLNKLSATAQFQFDENLNLIGKDPQTDTVILDKLGNPATPKAIIENGLKTFKIPLKEVKQGANIVSTDGEASKFKTIEEVNKYASQQGITDPDVIGELYDKYNV